MYAKGTMAAHGTVSRYKRHRCRCPECTAANAQSMREYRERQRGEGTILPRRKGSDHGTRPGYLKCTAGPDGSKCEPCRAANREYQRYYMQDFREGIRWDREDDW